jgi:hypothetical protein
VNKENGPDDRIAELRASGEAVGKLAADPDVFRKAVDAFRARDAEAFQAVLAQANLLEVCRLICRWLCSKHCIFTCLQLCGPPEKQPQLDVEEWRRFAELTARIAEDEGLLHQLLDAIDREDAGAWQQLVGDLKAEAFCHQLCHWLCLVRCQRVCELLCPPPPLITEVGFIPTAQIDSAGQAAGPSFPPGLTPADSKAPGGVGDHPYGGTTNIRGVFNIAGATQYKVEYATAPGGPWTAITTPVPDYRFNPAWFPGSSLPIFIYYTRAPASGSDWYDIAAMGLAGPDYLTDWLTPSIQDGLYYLRLTARTAALTEFASPLVPACVDNTAPTGPLPGGRPQITIRQGDHELGCCESVTRDGGPLTITVQAEDVNFSSLSVDLYGGCGASTHIFGKTYDGNTADTGAPAPGIDITWDPWAADVEPCCYVIFFRIWDRAITNNAWHGGHENENWMSITIA